MTTRIASGYSPHETGGYLAHRAASLVVGVSKEEHEKVLLELSGLRETLGKTQSALDAMQSRVQALELDQARVRTLMLSLSRVEGQLDLLIRKQQPTARPYYPAQSPPSSHGTDPDTS